MTSLAFLLIALALSVVGSLVLWIRHREPSSTEHHLSEFGEEMQALAPDTPRRPAYPGGPERRSGQDG